MIISRQMYSARRSRLLCSNLLVGTHRLKDSPDRFGYKKAAKIKKDPRAPGFRISRRSVRLRPDPCGVLNYKDMYETSSLVTKCYRLHVSTCDVSVCAWFLYRFLYVLCAVFGLCCVQDSVCVMCGFEYVFLAGINLCWVQFLVCFMCSL